MPGTVFNSTSLGVDLYNPALQNPATIASGATITNIYAGVNYGDAVYGDNSVAWTVYNFGTAEGNLSGASGVRLAAGGDVHNGSTTSTTARIAGDAYGIAILGTAGTVTNYGTVEATAGIGVYAADGSIVTNGTSGQSALITGYTGIDIAGIGTITNYGTISGVGGYSVGVSLYGGGVVTNQSGGLIAAEYGISVGIGAGTITNFGTIFGDEEAVSLVGAAGTVDNYGTLIGQYGYGAYLQAGGTVTNELGGFITGIVAGVKIDGAAGLVVNSGDIGNGTGGGIYIQAGGTVTNTASGRIVAYADGIFLNGGPSAVTNFGTIEATITGGGGTGVDINSGGVVINGTTGAILVASGLAVGVGSSGTLVNYGTIANADGNAVRLGVGGTLVSGAGGAGTALIVGYDGVRIYGPSAALTNYGTIASNGIGFSAQGVDFLSGGTLSNQGTILGINTYASGLNAGFANDLIINGGPTNGTATIAGWLNGIDQFSGTGTIVNYGTVSSSNGDGVYLQTGGTVTNTGGLIIGYNSGVRIGGGGTVVNTGTIVDTASTGNTIANAVTIGGGGVVNNDTLGLISGTYNGVRISGALGTVVNSGTIVGIGAYSGGASLYYGGTIVNNAGGFIDGLFSGAWIVGGNGTVINYGTLLGSGQPGYGFGVFLEAGYAGTIAVVANQPNAQIYGDAVGVEVYLGYGTLLNFGTVSSGKDAVYFHQGGTVTNYGGGLISAYRIGINIGNAVGSVINSGTITGQFGLDLSGGVDYVYNSGTVISSRGLGYGSGGVFLRGGGDVRNTGVVQASGGIGVYIGGGAGSVVNSGTILSQYNAGYSYFGVYLRAGGDVTNQATGLIDGSTGGIEIAGATGDVTNYGSINGAYSAIYLAAGGTVINQSQITGTNDVVLIRVDGLVTNYGTIAASAGTGVWLADGGTVANYGLITGTDDVVFTGFTTGTVINYGTIIDTGVYGDGVCLDAGGLVFNAGLISGPSVGVDVQNASGNVVNSFGGTIAGGGVYLRAGGTVSNASSGLIQGAIQGIAVGYGTGGVLNYGTIAGTGINSGGIYLTAGGTVTNANTGTITGTTDGIIIGNATGTPGATGVVLNYGTITGTNAYSTGVWLRAGGNVTNAAYGYIQGFDGVVTGYYGTGVGTVVNDGAITGVNLGVWLAAGGTVVNSSAITATSGDGVATGSYSYGGLGIVLNYGVVLGSSIGAWLLSGGSIVNFGTIANPGTYGHGVRISGGGTGFVHNYNLISGPTAGIYASAATYLINLGTVAGTGASGDGVRFNSYPGTVFNVGTILGTGRGVYMGGGGSVSNQLTGSIIGGSGVAINGAAGTVGNLGTIAGTAYPGVGIFLGQGGSVANGNASVTTALISGANDGVLVYGAPAGIVNYGTITASVSFASAVKLEAGGTVNNKSSGLIQGGGNGVVIYGGAGTLTNAGAIAGTTSAGVVFGAGGTIANGLTTAASITGVDGVVLLYAGGTVFNGSGSSTAAVIDGYTYGIFARDAASTVANYGTITGTAGAGAVLAAGGFIANAYGAVIASGNVGVEILNAAGALSNAGTVQGGNLGVYLAAGGSVVNALAGAIAGADGVRVIYGAGTVINYGAISATGTSGFAVQLASGGKVVNGAATATGASIVGTLRGVSAYNTAATVTNFGTIAATNAYSVGVYLHAGGRLVNQISGLVRGDTDGVVIGTTGVGAGTVSNRGTIEGVTGIGIRLRGGGTIVNGPGGATSALISGGFAGVQLESAAATIVNYGTILDAAYAGVIAFAGGSISNHQLITGYNGVFIAGGPGTVTNSGEISGTGASGSGIRLMAGGAIDNSGTIAGVINGVFFGDDTNLVNQGLISGADGVYGGTGVGVIANYGTIAASALGVRLVGGSTLFNAGTITGGYFSVYATGGYNQVAIDPSAVFVGNIDALLGGGDVVELAAGTGVFGGFDTTFIGFEQMAVDAGGDWQISNPVTFGSGFILTDAGALDFDNDLNNDGGLIIEAGGLLSFTGTVGGTGIIDFNGPGASLVIGNPSAMANSIIDFAPTDAIDFVGIGQAASYSYGGGVLRLRNSGGTQTAQAYLTTTVTNPHFTLGTDGTGGTVLSVNAQTGTFTGTYFNGVVLNDTTVQNPALVTSTAFITNNYGSHNGDAVYGTGAAAWRLANYATITTNSAVTGAVGVRFQAGGTVANSAVISGSINGIVIAGAGLVSNIGVIVATDTGTGAGVALHGGGTVFNSAGTIAGFNNGVFVSGGIGTVTNAGTIRSSATAGAAAVYFGQGGRVTNLAGGLITAYRSGVSIKGGAGQISNYGTIANASTQSSTTYLGAGGSVINGSGGLIFAAHRPAVVISGATGVVTNSGTILSTAGTAEYSAVVLNAGGVVSNAPNALISGHSGIFFGNLAGTVNNAGTVVSNAPLSGTRGAGVYFGAGGVFTNQAGGLVTAYRAAVSLAFQGATNANALITNYGVLSGSSGIVIGAGDTGDNTIVNVGTITGTSGIAILLGGGNDEIVIASSSQLNGAVGNFQPGDTFDLPFLGFSSAETVSLDAGNVLRINQNGALVYSIQLDPSQNFGINDFGLANDGAGGTLVVLGPDTTAPVTQQRVLAVNANSGPTPIGITAPTDPDDPPAALTVTVGSLPSDGTVVLADGVTPVSAGQTLTVDQLTTLQFTPTPNVDGQSSTLTYSVSDAVGNTVGGTAFLGINLPPPPNSPALINGLGGPEGFGENALPQNDDDSSSAIDITSVFGGGLSFFGHTYDHLFVNNNGNITFNAGLRAFTPGPINAGLNNPIIAAFWADVDTFGGPGVPTGGNATGSNTVYWDLDTVNHVFTATWDDVGYYNNHNDKLDAFQLRLIDQGGGNFDIELRYQAIYWTTGDASGGSGGLGGVVARAGYSAGDGVNSYELPQSGQQNEMLGLPSNPAPAGTLGATAETGVYRFQVRNGGVVPPPPTGLALSPDSDSAPAGDKSTTDSTPTITGFGISGDTITVFSDGSVVGTGTVQSDTTWAVTLSPLAAGLHNLTATQADGAGIMSATSEPLPLTIESAQSGGRWVFSTDPASGFSGVVLGINNGVAPVFPAPVAGKLNFEVFTNSTVSALPSPDPGFQATILDPGGTLENGFLTGVALQFGAGDFLVVDSFTGAATQSPSKLTLGTGNQTVVGAAFDTLVGGSGNQILSALAGNQTVVGGTGKDSIWGGANDSIVAGVGPDNQIVVIGSGAKVVAGTAGSATISLTTGDTVTALPGNQNVAISAASLVYVDLTGNTGLDAVIGSSGDTIVAGGGTTNVEGFNGGMLVKVGAAGKTNVSGSGNVFAGGNTIIGGSGELNYNPSLVSGAGDRIDLSGSGGTAQINAFSFGAVRSFGRDTILGSNTADSVFGGDGDRIGTGNGPIVGGTHQWVHADTVAGTSVGFGSNDTVSSTSYDTVTGVATRGTAAGTSSAQVTVGGFNTATDFIFYQNETAAANTAIVATSQATTVNGIASTVLVTPDGTVMTLVGVSQAQLTAALTAGTLFKV